mmetsp:Transcript_30236/g.72562  ORF Transcript_30236/g.72562 Transcript_30236/m.72562 type:complete len:505 (-) Transcript_30236:87-1601(-)|eukprot:CAMPEP_0113627804 /NCGR_PEP_ID=MMETSP0017_2-20120614/14404_1 /TAXON_ID=2856 /ORGANISM="Cylindrotheca closterium" /LENGTH=504 /DNA_ID=CAMNT_0000538081 /DNA_START=77 /DNA_END=1591 /DNA_ORIENTATION=+ /assembly_acc=CAM_ASM_000147
MTSQIHNYINAEFVAPETGKFHPVENPANGETIGQVAASSAKDVDDAVKAADAAFPAWSKLTVKARAAIMMKFHSLIKEHADELADLIVLENGKNKTEALADVAKGNETVEYACSLPQLVQGTSLKVSGQVTCVDRRDPLGVIASIVPFNFPLMVPMWTVPIALVMGNTVVLKPSEKVPLTMQRVAKLFEEAGFPKGVFNMVQGMRDAVEALIDHPSVKAVTFVGSSPVAKIVSDRCRALDKRCTALGGAKNHLVALPDCEMEGAASDICVSFAGCAGQRCMAASVLLLDGEQDGLLNSLIEKASKIEAGSGPGKMGPVIDGNSLNKIHSYIEAAEKAGAKILLDGRSWKKNEGNWIGPTIILHNSKDDKTMKEEVFGPVLSIYVVSSWEEALEIENANPFGNAAAIYTTNGGNAEWFTSKFRASMLGINVGIPVPREPFSFGGLYGTKSKFGDMDITGDGAVEFFSNRIKVTSKWPVQRRTATKRTHAEMAGVKDAANFAGQM